MASAGEWLRTALVEAAQAASRCKNSSVSAHYHHIAVRRGTKRAAVARAHTLLIRVYQLITHEQEYQEAGATYLDDRDRQDQEHRLVRQLEKLGFAVTLTPTSPAA